MVKNLTSFATVMILSITLDVPQAFAAPITWTLFPSLLTVTTGQSVSVDVLISGHAPGATPSIGAFDFNVGYDPAILSPAGVAFAPFLGDPSAGEALTGFSITPGDLEFAEVSLLSPAALDGLQPADFRLATLSFNAAVSGTTSVTFRTATVDDAFGNKLPAVPEPNTLVFAALGIGIVVVRNRRGTSYSFDRFLRAFFATCLALVTALALTAGWARGATITNATVNPAGSANVTIGANALTIDKTFTSLDPIDITFHVMMTGSPTMYSITDTVNNNSGVTWSDFHFIVLFPGGGTTFVGNPAPTSDGDGSFVLRPDPESFLPDTTILDWSGGTVPSGQKVIFTATLDVNDNPFGDYDFTLREQPTVPEPGSLTLALIGFGAAIILISQRKTLSG
jgi:hypothetical protein